MQKASSVQHGRYTIKVMEINDEWRSAAYLTGAPSGAGCLAQSSAPTRDEAIAAAAEILDEKDQELRANWRLDERTGFLVPTTQEYELALKAAGLAEGQIRMLKANALAGEGGLTAPQLADAGGYADYSTANLLYGKAGRALAERMGWKVPASRLRDGEDGPTTVLAAWRPTPEDPAQEGFWIMYPELREALTRMFDLAPEQLQPTG